ncbi:MAG: MBOAT family protein [Lachnospiraceae bacterium]|nr:MBOAT family protein [Lachnospiraceae bacterium]
MAYNTNTYFVLFLPAAMILYQLTPKKYRFMSLLAASIAFFMIISRQLIYWALITTAITYFGGICIEDIFGKAKLQISDAKAKGIEIDKKGIKKAAEKKASHVVKLAIVGVVAILAGLKYTNFTIEIINSVFKSSDLHALKILVPIGISFYSMQAIGYLLDVYWKRIEAERNILKLLLFMIFFPTLMEGPICRWTDVNEQLFEGKPITGDSFVQGFIRIVWGLFKRMLIADRLNTAVNIFYKPTNSYNGLMMFIAMLATTIQLYMEFSGTIDIVIGSARIFNIKLPENFRQPFFAKSAAEFWRRWHISLGTWFKNYIFYPVSTSHIMKKWNKFGRKHAGKYVTTVVTSAIALFPVWMLNGLWHGPKVPYIMYGVYYFVILLLEVMLEPAGEKFWNSLRFDINGKFVSAFRMVRTWVIILVGEVLFRAETLGQFATMMKNMFRGPWDGGFFAGRILEVGLDIGDFAVVLLGMFVVFAVDVRLEKNPEMFENIPKLPTARRWVIYYALIMSIVIFGAYGVGYQPADLIYAGF